jgi:hypothetical protein
MAAPILQFKRGSAGIAGTIPALRPGEPAISLNNFDFFIGFNNSIEGNRFFGSHRYWKREDGTESLRLSLVDRDGTNNIQLKSPNSLSGITTYTLPETPIDTYILSTNSNGILSWVNSIPASTVLSGITTFIDTTDNVLGNPDTGAVQIDGGLGVNKNVSIGGSFYVAGTSEFIGIVTFRGGTINLGDSTSDNIYVGGEFTSSLNPNDDNLYDIGISTQRWRHAHFSGVGTFATGAIIDNIQIGINGATKIDTSFGGLTLDSASGMTTVDDDLTVNGNLFINGSTTQINTSSLIIEDRTLELGRVDSTIPTSSTTWDLGILFNYNDGTPKKSAVVWESADAGKSNISIFKFATVLAADSEGNDSTTPQLSVITFAPIEIASLWVNNECTVGAKEVIGCLSGELNLQNITIDAGSF